MNQNKRREADNTQKKKKKEKKKKITLQLAMEYFSRASRNSNEIITKCRQ